MTISLRVGTSKQCFYLFLNNAPDRDAVFQLSLAVERQGLDMTTTEGVPIEHFADLVADQ